MKKLKIFLTIAITALFIYSCEDDKEIVVLNNEGAIPSSLITPANGSSFVLTASTGADSFETFGWTESDYGAVLSRTYNLELDLGTGNFVNPSILVKSVGLSYTMRNADLNLLLYDAGITEKSDAYLRILTWVKNKFVDTLYSSVNKISITPYLYNKPIITKPSNGLVYVLTEANSTKEFESFEWNAVDYGAVFANSYTLEIDVAGNDFNSPTKVITTASNVSSVTVQQINKALIADGVAVGIATDIEFRIVSTSNGINGVVIGDAIELTLTAYSTDPVAVEPLYLVGNATLAGWNNTAGIEIAWDEANQEYSVITTFIAGGMKILEVSGQWAPQWGDDGTHTGILLYRPDEATADPAEITSPGEGSYKIRVDIVNLTYSFEAQ